MLKRYRNSLIEKIKEALSSLLPVVIIVLAVCFLLVPIPADYLLSFLLGAVFIVFGMALFTLGADLAMTPIGQYIGSETTRTRILPLILAVCFAVGAIITISEPDLQVLAEQVPGIPNMTLMLCVGCGVGLFLVIAVLRILLKIKLSYILIVCYAAVFIFAQFVPPDFVSAAFDSGGVTTGPMTVPFLMAFGVGISNIRADSSAEEDSFGIVALCSVGPILAVLILGLCYGGSAEYVPAALQSAANTKLLFSNTISEMPKYFAEVLSATLPIAAFFYLFLLLTRKMARQGIARATSGLLYTYLGLVLFLTGVNTGFLPIGSYLGAQLGALSYNWIVIPVGMLIGYFVVTAEPAVHVLNKNVYELTSGAIPKRALSISLSIGVSVSIGLSMARILLGIPIMYILIPGYLIAAVLTRFVPPMFVAIAFDSGGVASGPMTATFLLPFAIGVCSAVGANPLTDGFGLVALVAMTPLITIQALGLIFKIKTRRAESAKARQQEDIIEL